MKHQSLHRIVWRHPMEILGLIQKRAVWSRIMIRWITVRENGKYHSNEYSLISMRCKPMILFEYSGNRLFVTLEVIVMEHAVMVNGQENVDQNVRRLTIPVSSLVIIRPVNYHLQLVISINMKRSQIIKVIQINKIKLWTKIQSLRKYNYAFLETLECIFQNKHFKFMINNHQRAGYIYNRGP